MECGVFEIDEGSGGSRTLSGGKFPDCIGVLSPDGKRVLRLVDGQLTMLELATGGVQIVGDGLRGGYWSPDGRWIAAIRGYTRIVLIDASNFSRQRELGRSDGEMPKWSPDSKYLLMGKSETACGSWELSSLELIDVLTGKRREIKSSHCKILATAVGWMEQIGK